MSEEKPIGLAVAEKFFGLLVILIGALTVNFTLNDPPEGIVAPFSPIFIAAGLALVAIGIFLILAKAE
jgi:hypothetical protein